VTTRLYNRLNRYSLKDHNKYQVRRSLCTALRQFVRTKTARCVPSWRFVHLAFSRTRHCTSLFLSKFIIQLVTRAHRTARKRFHSDQRTKLQRVRSIMPYLLEVCKRIISMKRAPFPLPDSTLSCLARPSRYACPVTSRRRYYLSLHSFNLTRYIST